MFTGKTYLSYSIWCAMKFTKKGPELWLEERYHPTFVAQINQPSIAMFFPTDLYILARKYFHGCSMNTLSTSWLLCHIIFDLWFAVNI